MNIIIKEVRAMEFHFIVGAWWCGSVWKTDDDWITNVTCNPIERNKEYCFGHKDLAFNNVKIRIKQALTPSITIQPKWMKRMSITGLKAAKAGEKLKGEILK